ncbi:MAG: Fic family protein [Methanomassiliicoccaceae archaeon]|nr:Fic family protein [Methanomassiliicoccaceae archaeon]
MKKMELSKYKANERKGANKDIFSALESIARMQSIKGSNAIEGIITTDERLEKIVNESSAPLSHDEEEIIGYRDVLDMINKDHAKYDISENNILNMHRLMLSHTETEGGRYKEKNNIIVSEDTEGNREVVFAPVSFEETPRSMEQLILAYIDARDDSAVDPVILIPCFILDFLCIHPFIDGNGRVSRLLSLLMMYREGIDVGRYISFESQIDRYKKNYYESLRRSSKDWHTGENDYVPFIENFIFTLYTCYKELDIRFNVAGDKKMTKGNRIEAAILNSFGPITKKEIKELLPDISVTTIEAKLSELLKSGVIKKIGSYTNAGYIRNK